MILTVLLIIQIIVYAVTNAVMKKDSGENTTVETNVVKTDEEIFQKFKNSKGEEVLYVNGPTWSLQPKVEANAKKSFHLQLKILLKYQKIFANNQFHFQL